MANNICAFSAALDLDPGQFDEARKIVDEVLTQEAVDGLTEYHPGEYTLNGTSFEIDEDEHHLWFYGEENGDPDLAEVVIKELVERLKIDLPVYLTWANYCSRPVINEFSGGAWIVQRGKDTEWNNSLGWVMDKIGK